VILLHVYMFYKYPFYFQAEVYVNLLDDNIQLPTEKNNLLEVEMSSKADISDVETSSTLSTIHSRHVTPSHSKISTPKYVNISLSKQLSKTIILLFQKGQVLPRLTKVNLTWRSF